MQFRRLNRAIHRDLGYFIAGTTILYAVSGLAVNHARHWDPSFIVQREESRVTVPQGPDSISRDWVLDLLRQKGLADQYRAHDFPSTTKLKIYLDEGSLLINLRTGHGELEMVRRRPLLYSFNLLHLNPSDAWLIFSDIYAAGLIVVTVTGMLMINGTRGAVARSALLVAAGLAVPFVFILLL